MQLLVEAKNRRKKIDVSDIDDLWMRLSEAPPGLIGVLFTTGEITRGAIERIETRRSREIILFNKDEVEDIRAHRIHVWPWLERKRRAFRVEGRVWFGRPGEPAYRKVALPSSLLEFHMEDLKGTVISSRSGFANSMYSMQIADWRWGEGVRLMLPLTLNNPAGMADILRQLHKRFGLSSSGMFSIQQSDVTWFGLGVADLQHTLENWKDRYRTRDVSRVHHSESVRYFDELRDGWVLVSTQQRVNVHRESGVSDAFLHSSRLVIHLPGVPVELAPYVEMARETRNDWAQFTHAGAGCVQRRWLKRPMPLDVVGRGVERSSNVDDPGRGELFVHGVVARNPFFRKGRLPKELVDASHCLQDLPTFELLVCDARDWHPLEKELREYLLEGFDVTQTGDVRVIRPFGTWVGGRHRSLPERKHR